MVRTTSCSTYVRTPDPDPWSNISVDCHIIVIKHIIFIIPRLVMRTCSIAIVDSYTSCITRCRNFTSRFGSYTRYIPETRVIYQIPGTAVPGTWLRVYGIESERVRCPVLLNLDPTRIPDVHHTDTRTYSSTILYLVRSFDDKLVLLCTLVSDDMLT